MKHSHQQGNLDSKERLCPAQKQQNTEVNVSYQQDNNKPHSVHIRKAMLLDKLCYWQTFQLWYNSLQLNILIISLNIKNLAKHQNKIHYVTKNVSSKRW